MKKLPKSFIYKPQYGTLLSRHLSTYCTNPRLGLSSVLASTAIGVQLSTAHSVQCSGNSYYSTTYLACKAYSYLLTR